jgi:hypothetical protein
MGRLRPVGRNNPGDPQFILYTVPHTGTFFTFRFLRLMGFYRGNKNPGKHGDYFHMHPIQKKGWDEYGDITQKNKMVVTARHPHRTFLSHLVRSNDRGMTEALSRKMIFFYERFLQDLKDNPNHEILTLDCEPHLRKKTLTKVANFVNVDFDEYGEVLDKYASEWMPFHYYKNEEVDKNPLIAEYNKNPKMIEEYDVSYLDEAIEWYEKVRIKE